MTAWYAINTDKNVIEIKTHDHFTAPYTDLRKFNIFAESNPNGDWLHL